MEEDKTATRRMLGECHIFSALSEVELRKVANLAEEREYEVGATIFREGTSADELLVVQEGKVALQTSLLAPVSQTTRHVTVDIVSQNEVIGWAALLEPPVNNLTAVSLQRVKALSINSAKLRSLLSANHHIGYRILSELIKVMASRLDDTRRVLVSERLLPLKLE